jgi:lipid II:glycine glycyltransferase (peptidoglycan interpeptide bridge formation enzyme)
MDLQMTVIPKQCELCKAGGLVVELKAQFFLLQLGHHQTEAEIRRCQEADREQQHQQQQQQQQVQTTLELFGELYELSACILHFGSVDSGHCT